LEVIVDNEQGVMVERTVTLRPYPAVKLFRDAMYASLKDKLPPDVWDYPTTKEDGTDKDARLVNTFGPAGFKTCMKASKAIPTGRK
jgi:hypothetical protein